MRRDRILVLILSFLVILISGVKADISITIPETVTINSSWIELGDIAEIRGVSGEEFERLASLKIARAVLPGYTRTIPAEQIIILIENEGFLSKNMEINIPDFVYVSSAGRILSEEEMLKQAEDFLYSSLGDQADKLVIRPRFIPPEIILPDKDYRLEYEYSGANRAGNVSLQLSVIVDDVLYKKLFLGFEVLIEKEVFVAKRPVSAGEKISADDFYLATRKLGAYRGELIQDLNNQLVKDGVVNIEIPKDGILTTYYLKLPVIVHSGDILQAEVVIGSIKVSTVVTARQSGKKGDYITVENNDTGHRFKAQIINSHLVRLVQ